MKVILKEDVKDLGTIGTIVDVADGYGRNYLIPRNLAVEANPRNIKEFEHHKRIIEARAKKIRRSAEDVAAKISSMSISFEVNAGEDDRLFGAITSRDIADEIAKSGIEIDRKRIALEEPIKRLGSYEVPVKVHTDVTATIRVEVKKKVAE